LVTADIPANALASYLERRQQRAVSPASPTAEFREATTLSRRKAQHEGKLILRTERRKVHGLYEAAMNDADHE
jgi:hypothetical protein